MEFGFDQYPVKGKDMRDSDLLGIGRNAVGVLSAEANVPLIIVSLQSLDRAIFRQITSHNEGGHARFVDPEPLTVATKAWYMDAACELRTRISTVYLSHASYANWVIIKEGESSIHVLWIPEQFFPTMMKGWSQALRTEKMESKEAGLGHHALAIELYPC